MRMGRYFTRSLISVFFIWLNDSSRAQKEVLRRQTVITSPDDLEEFYALVKRVLPFTYVDDGQAGYLRNEDYSGPIMLEKYKKLTVPQRSELQSFGVDQVNHDLEQKSRVCAHIFNSVLFQALGNEEVIDLSPQRLQTRSELQSSNPRLFNAIYAGTRWLNPYTQYSVSLKNTPRKLREHAFSCVTRERGAGEYRGYYISPIYQTRSVPGCINGRFVFIDGDQNELKLFARAEEPATVDANVIEQTQRGYYNSGKRFSSEPSAERSELCTLPIAEKIRVCSLIFGAVEFERGLKFLPTAQYVEEECQRISVYARVNSFKEYAFQRPFDMIVSYNEWVIGCKVVPEEGATITNYISAGWDRYTAIVFERFAADSYKPFCGLVGVGPLSRAGLIRPVKVMERSSG